MRRFAWLVCWSALLLAFPSGFAVADGWSWNPFARRTTTDGRQMLDGQPLNRGSGGSNRDDPSLLESIGHGTQKLLTATTDLLTFRWARRETKPKSRTVSEYPRSANDKFPLAPSRQDREQGPAHGLGGLLGGDETEKSERPQDWIIGRRPG